MSIRIGNGAGFWGDQLDAPRQLVAAASLDYLTLEYLAELTMSILARQREKNPQAGYVSDIVPVLQSLLPGLRTQPHLKLITNAGGMNPVACAQAVGKLLAAANLGDTPLGVVTGDDLLPRLAQIQADGWPFTNLDTGQPLASLSAPVVAANAYLGAQPIAQALAEGARIVLTGRVADAALTVGPAAYEFAWDWQDWNRLAAASVAGHLIECGAQATGGYSAAWEQTDLTSVGYPIVELEPSGAAVLTKPKQSGGSVNRATVTEQLIYEIGDPAHYLTPDVDVDFTTVELEDLGDNRVAVRGATGRPAPETYKVSLAYKSGFLASGQLLIFGPGAVRKAQACGAMILARLAAACYQWEASHIEVLGGGQAVPGLPAEALGTGSDPREVILRVAVRHADRAACERFLREFAPLVTSGPSGVAGYTQATGGVRPVFAYWPTLVPRADLVPRVEVRSAQSWASILPQ